MGIDIHLIGKIILLRYLEWGSERIYSVIRKSNYKSDYTDRHFVTTVTLTLPSKEVQNNTEPSC